MAFFTASVRLLAPSFCMSALTGQERVDSVEQLGLRRRLVAA
jgi:hypothetical protein